MSYTTLVVTAIAWLATWIVIGRAHRLEPGPTDVDARPSVSVVVPARNEELRLPPLLAALAESELRPHEIVVVDDGSSDRTPELARSAGARVITVAPPDGWTGKAWACATGASASTGDVIVFFDADTEPGPRALGALVDAAAGGELVSAHPLHRVEKLYERVSAGPAVVALLGAGTGGAAMRTWWRRPVAFGPAVAVQRQVYEHIGGHAAVRGEIIEDVALARRAHAAGTGVVALLAGPLIRYRMYPEGPRSLVEGWSKNLALGAGSTPMLRLAVVTVWVTMALRVGIELAVEPSTAAAVAYVAYGLQFGVVARRIGRFGPVVALVHPVLLAAFVGLCLRSAVLVVFRRSVSWRGRDVPVRA